MQYDPIKRKLGKVFNTTPFLRKLFYRMLDLLLLRTWHIKKELKKWGQPAAGSYILDAGSGFGQYSYYMGRKWKDCHIDAIDVKEEQIEDCSRFFEKIAYKNIHFEVGDLTKYVKEDAYQLVLSVDVMEHIEEDLKVFENFNKSMKKGGMLLISTPSDQGGSDVHEHDDDSFIDEHVRDGYNIEEIQEKLKKAGFSKTSARYSYGRPGKISWRLSMKYPIIMLGKSKFFYILLPFYYLIFFPISCIFNAFDLGINHKSGTGLIVKAWK